MSQTRKEICKSGNGCYQNNGIMRDLSKVSPVLSHHRFINKTNQSFSNVSICTMSNTWVEGKKRHTSAPGISCPTSDIWKV